MRLTLPDVHLLAASVVADYPGISLDIAASDGEAESVELLLTMPDGHTQLLRVPRLDHTTFERELREQVQAEFAKR